MSKSPNTFAKRQREADKKRKADDKRTRRREKKDEPPAAPAVDGAFPSPPADEIPMPPST